MRLIIAFDRRAILRNRNAALPTLWREPFHDPEVMRAKGRRQELVDQIMAAAGGAEAPDEFVATAAREVAALPPEERRAAAWQQAHNLILRAIMAKQLLENT